jgi:hypothetical protein
MIKAYGWMQNMVAHFWCLQSALYLNDYDE